MNACPSAFSTPLINPDPAHALPDRLAGFTCALRPITHALAVFFGAFTLLNLLGEWRHPGFDANIWWIDLRWLPPAVAKAGLGLGALALLATPCLDRCPRLIRRSARGALTGLLCATLANAVNFFHLAATGCIEPGVLMPLSLLVAPCILLILVAARRGSHGTRRRKDPTPFRVRPGLLRRLHLPTGSFSHLITFSLALAACAFGFPLAQMLFFGKTDYRRPADAAIVFGARAYADGRPSDALADRVRTACQLYQSGLVGKLIFSGGPGDGDIHETESMRRFAATLGVPVKDILLDPGGLNTQATAQNTSLICHRHGFERVLAVSHFYHLPRIKMTFHREGFDVLTVPAVETYTLTQLPYNMAREVAALWVYYLRPLAF